ncbi:hypothetical protein [Methylacidimicrobium cyclopophantes]|uniref:hypothetical protein n=1 Tax=Methylacidimicrobium cyclopophantes TaxID=1041766 RepID=UPI0015B3F565|nr:hypothetical protein [Methylacidimicrobium cyclopophantes]
MSDNRGGLRLLRGWVPWLPYPKGIRIEPGLDAQSADPDEGMAEESTFLLEEIERTQEAVRNLMGTNRAIPPWMGEGDERNPSENARLWRAVTQLATALDLLSERLEILERQRRRAKKP